MPKLHPASTGRAIMPMPAHDRRSRISAVAEILDREAVDAELPPVEAYGDEPESRPNGKGPVHESPGTPLLALLWFATLDKAAHQEQLVKRLLLVGSFFVVFGESNSGKTFWVLDLMLAVAAGVEWRRRPTRKGLVIYVAGEGAASVRARVAAYRRTHPEITGGLPFAIIPQAVDFLDAGSVAILIQTIRAAESEAGEKCVVVVVDTFARAMAGGDENSSKDVGVAVAAADRIRAEIGCAVGFVHHSGKDASKGARGSSALRAATDTEILIEGQTGTRTATASKQRDLEIGEPMPFELVPVTIGTDPDDGKDITSCVVKHLDDDARAAPTAIQVRGKAQRQFIAALRARAGSAPQRTWTLFDLRQLGKELGMSKSTARSAVDAIVTLPYMHPTAGGYRFTDGEPK